MKFHPRLCLPSLILSLFALPPVHADGSGHGAPPVRAPFQKGEDSLCVNDWWNRPANPIIDLKVPRDQVICFGIHTVSNKTLKLSAQLYPLYPEETREVRLEIETDGAWKEVARQNVNDLGWSTTFRIDKWDDSKNTKYRLRHGEKATFEGLVRADPRDKNEIVLAALSCNSNKDRSLRLEYTRNINHQDPDLVFFAGDHSSPPPSSTPTTAAGGGQKTKNPAPMPMPTHPSHGRAITSTASATRSPCTPTPTRIPISSPSARGTKKAPSKQDPRKAGPMAGASSASKNPPNRSLSNAGPALRMSPSPTPDNSPAGPKRSLSNTLPGPPTSPSAPRMIMPMR